MTRTDIGDGDWLYQWRFGHDREVVRKNVYIQHIYIISSTIYFVHFLAVFFKIQGNVLQEKNSCLSLKTQKSFFLNWGGWTTSPLGATNNKGLKKKTQIKKTKTILV